MISKTDIFIKKIKQTLEDDILKYWSVMQDPMGGFFSDWKEDGTADKDAPRDVVRNSHILWAFSTAYRRLKKKEFLLPAINAKDYYLAHCLDHKFGGAFMTVDKEGEKLDTTATLMAQAYSILALCEFYAATKDEEAIKNAVNIYKIVEKEFHDSKNRGYFEEKTRDYKLTDGNKDLKSHIHLLEAYAALYKIWKDESIRLRTKELIDLIIEKFFNPESGHLYIRFDENWNLIKEGASYGNDFEASWLLMDCAYALKDIEYINKVKNVSARLAKAGMEGWQEDGSIHCYGNENVKVWVQAESIVANLCAWKYHSDGEGAAHALKTWEFLKSHPSIDNDHLHDHPYHSTNLCIQVLNLFR